MMIILSNHCSPNTKSNEAKHPYHCVRAKTRIIDVIPLASHWQIVFSFTIKFIIKFIINLIVSEYLILVRRGPE